MSITPPDVSLEDSIREAAERFADELLAILRTATMEELSELRAPVPSGTEPPPAADDDGG